MDDHAAQLRSCMYQYSRAIYRSVKDLIDPYVDRPLQIEYRRAVLSECEETMERLAEDPQYFARPDRALFADIRRYFPITAQAQVAWSVREGIGAAIVKRLAQEGADLALTYVSRPEQAEQTAEAARAFGVALAFHRTVTIRLRRGRRRRRAARG